MEPRLFGNNGIVGVANSWPMNVETMSRVGAACGNAFLAATGSRRVVIGKDPRITGHLIEEALIAGLLSVGANVYLFGPIPKPAVGWLTSSLRADLGIMISASREPYELNGVNFYRPDGARISSAQERQIEALCQAGTEDVLAAPCDLGRAERIDDAQARYIEFVKSTFPKDQGLNGLRVVLDCAHGAACDIAPAVLWELGAEVLPIGTGPDGQNINDGCGVSAPEYLAREVCRARADIGIAFDGAAERFIVSDEAGTIIDGEQLLGLIATRWHERGTLKRQGIVSTPTARLGLELHLAGLGLTLERTASVNERIEDRMLEAGFNVGGDPAGTFVFTDHSQSADGLVAALQVLSVVSIEQRPASDVCNVFEPLPVVRRDIPIAGKSAPPQEDVRQLIEGLGGKLNGKGRLSVRQSHRSGKVQITAEGEDGALVAEVANEAAAALRQSVA